jgi:hypothetical protein
MASGNCGEAMPPIRVRDVNEALEIALRLKAEGKYDWFRGQLQDWTVCPTFLRLTEEQRQEALHRLGRFEHWIRVTPGLETLIENPDMFFAVAQHYGLPTNYVDFTTNPEIAAFFAADNPSNRSLNRDCCIICLDTQDLIEFWKAMPPKNPPPELIEIEVNNLWRLEAQEGRFLFCRYDKIEHIYDFDRILFPYTGPLKYLPTKRIYPKEKSSLEILLDQFFMTEELAENTKLINSLPGFQSMSRHRIKDTEGVDTEILARTLSAHPSWAQDALRSWLNGEKEKYHDTVRDKTCQVYINEQLLSDRYSLREQIFSLLSKQDLLRQISIRWECISKPPFKLPASDELTSALNHLWDGVRRLPYSNEQISYSISETIALWYYSSGGCGYAETRGQFAAEKCFGKDALEFEFGAADGSYSRAFASAALLTRAIRSDIKDFLAPSWSDRLMNRQEAFPQVIRKPQLLFDFSRLADVLIRQIVPFQIVFRRHKNAVFFSPARLGRFGLP